jgi:hypothetical protein
MISGLKKETGMRIALVASSLLLVGGMATACGGDNASSAADNASTDDFCKIFEEAPTGNKPSQDELDTWVGKLKDTGTPKGISGDERHGFEVLVKALDDANVNDIGADSQLEDVVKDAGDRKDVAKFSAYYVKTCAGANLPTDVPTSVPTGLPTEFPTSLPTDFPSSLLSDLPTDFPSSLLSDLPTS